MKTRIEVETLKNGTKTYWPQYKGFFGWKFFEHNSADDCYGYHCYSSMEKAQEFIDYQNGEEVESKTYIKYP